MGNNNATKRFLKGLIVFAVLAIIALIIGMFFAFGGDNPILIHVANIIDMLLVVITVIFLMIIAYVGYSFLTGNGQSLTKSSKPSSKTKGKHDEIPELSELIDNLDATSN